MHVRRIALLMLLLRLHHHHHHQELEKLQDAVGTFPDTIAMSIIQEELGRPADEVFEFTPPSPIASASIGQVGGWGRC